MEPLIASLLLVAFCGLVCGQDYWIQEDHGSMPDYPFRGGSEPGKSLYICQSNFHGETCVGKIGYGYGSCRVPWGDKENSDYYYSVLVAPPWALYTFQWKTGYDKGNVPSGAVRVDSGIYVGRHKRDGYYIPGKVVSKHKALFYGYNGKEYDVRKNYDVLVKVPRGVKKYELYDVTYDLANAVETMPGDYKAVGAKQRVTNNSPFRAETEVTLHYESTVSRSWSEVEEFEVVRGRSTKVTAGIPSVIGGTAEWGVTKTHTYTYSYGETATHTVNGSHTVRVKLPPKSEVVVYMVAKQAEVDVPFEGNLRIFFDDGVQRVVQIHGVYADMHMASFESRIDEETSSEEE
ncbi:natterin-3-like [Apostichopus japonicus]|uniref:natterin-3-like n=1 Tax=Stichopus japonicus TaxID=307972 RepID=UPI003AB38FD7